MKRTTANMGSTRFLRVVIVIVAFSVFVVLIVLLRSFFMITYRKNLPLERKIIGSYVYPESSFDKWTSHYQGISGTFCPVVFLNNNRAYFCNHGWGEYELTDGLLEVDFENGEQAYQIDKLDDVDLVLSNDEETINMRRIDEIFMVNLILQNQWCSVYDLDNEVIREVIKIDDQEIHFFSSQDATESMNCDGYKVVNRNTIICHPEENVIIFGSVPEFINIFNFNLLRFVVFASHRPDRIFIPCPAVDVIEWVNADN